MARLCWSRASHSRARASRWTVPAAGMGCGEIHEMALLKHRYLARDRVRNALLCPSDLHITKNSNRSVSCLLILFRHVEKQLSFIVLSQPNNHWYLSHEVFNPWVPSACRPGIGLLSSGSLDVWLLMLGWRLCGTLQHSSFLSVTLCISL